MQRLKEISPAVLIILTMILINAGIILYYAEKFSEADKQQREQTAQVQEIARINSKILAQQEQERDIRSDQACELFESDHLQDVQQLESTYKYLITLSPEEREQNLNRFIILQLPQTEQEALIDRAPEYCDGTTRQGDDIGLPEPDPMIPDRPAKLVEFAGPRPDYPTPEEKQNGAKSPDAIKGQDLRNP